MEDNMFMSSNLDKLEPKTGVDYVNYDEVDDTNQPKYNRKQRRKMMKNYLKSTIVPIVNADGKVIGTTNQYKENRKKERGNIKAWVERVSRSQDMGNQIHKINTADNNRRLIQETQEMLEKKRIEYVNTYGEKQGLQMFDIFVSSLLEKNNMEK